MKGYMVFGAVHAVLTIAAWYFVAGVAQGVADGTGIAPLWLIVLYYGSLILMAPLGLGVLALKTGFGGFSLPDFALFSLVAVLNSALIAALVRVIVMRFLRPADSGT